MSITPGVLLSATRAVSLTMRVALEHHERGRLREAAALYQEVQSIDPQNADALFLLGIIALAVRNHQAAERLLAAASKRMPRSARVHAALGDAIFKNGRAGESLASYWRALSLDPGNASAYVDVADALVAMKPAGGNDALAAMCLHWALHFDPAHALANAGLGHIHLRADQPKAAEVAYRAAITREQHCAAYHNSLGAALYRQKQYAGAADAYRHALTLQPKSPEIFLNLGNAMRGLGDSQRAEECLRRAIQLRPRYAKALKQLGNLLRDKGDTRLAAACYREAVQIQPDPDTWCELGAAITWREDWRESQDAYQAALELAPGHAVTMHALAANPIIAAIRPAQLPLDGAGMQRSPVQ